ncbi:MAG: adenosylcobinamide-GDP ribazoletransferase [Oscillospiraceae bacterium]|nr:adenosylcobinamide-GDP ribazoletransferase [Oscillospiraceae bacterium]
MKRVFKGLIMAFGMFTTIPMPKVWDDRGAKYVMTWFPIVGLVIGLIWWVSAELLVYLQWPSLQNPPFPFFSMPSPMVAGIQLIMCFIFVGLIHLDGFMDTCDAILSRRSVEDKLRILGDSNVGAFSVIMIVFLLIMQFAALESIMRGNVSTFFSISIFQHPFNSMLGLLIVIPIVSRTFSAMAMLCIRPMKADGYVGVFRPINAMPHRIIIPIPALISLFLAWMGVGWVGVVVVLAVAIGYCVSMLIALKSFEFKGVSGDLAGFSLVISELCGLFALAIVS